MKRTLIVLMTFAATLAAGFTAANSDARSSQVASSATPKPRTLAATPSPTPISLPHLPWMPIQIGGGNGAGGTLPLPPSTARGPEVPFPWGNVTNFPWGRIEGVWVVNTDGVELLFSFEIQQNRDGSQLLKVVQLESSTGAIVAEGVGISVKADKLVRAEMNGVNGSYVLFVGAYKPTTKLGLRSKTVTVLTVRAFTQAVTDQDYQFAAKKLSNVPFNVEKPLLPKATSY